MTVTVSDNPAELSAPLESILTAEGSIGEVECLLFLAGEPLTCAAMASTLSLDPSGVNEAVRVLRDRYDASGSALQVIEIAGGYQMSTRPEFAATAGKFLAPHANRLSRPALEAATIVAYRQPVTQAEVEAIRGVASDGVLKTLVERELIAEAGRRSTPGRPILYGTTPAFLHYFGLVSLADLPALEEDETEPGSAQTEISVALDAAGVGAA